MPRQMLPFASMLTRVVRALRRCSGTASSADRRAGDRVDQQRRVVAGGQAELGPALRAAGPARATAAASPSVMPAQRGRRGPGRQQRPADLVGAGHDRLAQEVGAQLVQLADRLAVERLREARLRGHAAVDRVRGEVILEHDLGAAHARQRGHRVVGVGDHQEGEVGRAEIRRQPQPDLARPRRRRRLHDATKPSEVIGSSSSGSRTVSSAASTGPARAAGRLAGGLPRRPGRPGGHRSGHAPATSCASSCAAGVPGAGVQLVLGRHLDAVELRRVQAEDLLLPRRAEPRVVGELVTGVVPVDEALDLPLGLPDAVVAAEGHLVLADPEQQLAHDLGEELRPGVHQAADDHGQAGVHVGLLRRHEAEVLDPRQADVLDDEVQVREVGRRVVDVGDVERVLVQRPDRRALVHVDVLDAEFLSGFQVAVRTRGR